MIKAHIRAAILSLTVCVIAFAAFGCASDVKAIDWVYANDIVTEYDGQPHLPEINGIAEGFELTYSASEKGEFSSLPPEYILPGEYKLYYKVSRSGFRTFVGSATVTIRKGRLSDLFAADETVVYDGLPHFPTVIGVQSGDTVEFTSGGEPFTGATEIGEYKVYYYVDRGTADGYGSCTIRIIEDISGLYLNAEQGVIEITRENIADYAYTAGTITVDGKEYKKLASGRRVCSVRINGGAKRYFAGAQDERVNVALSDGKLLSSDGETLADITAYNYIESASEDFARDYTASDASITIGESGELEIVLSSRAPSAATDSLVTVLYDGEYHGFDLTGDVLYITQSGLSAIEPRYSEVGEYTVGAIVFESEKLPASITATLIIAPDISGIYRSQTDVIVISGISAAINGETAELSYRGGWTLNGKPIEKTNGGLNLEGIAFSASNSCERVVLMRVFGTRITLAAEYDIIITKTQDGIVVEVDGNELLREDCATSITVKRNGAAWSDIGGEYIFGMGDLPAGVVTIIDIEEN